MLKNWFKVILIGVHCLSLYGVKQKSDASKLSAQDVVNRILPLDHDLQEPIDEKQVTKIIEIMNRSIGRLVMSSFHLPDVKKVNWDQQKSANQFYKDLLNAVKLSQQASLELVESLMNVKVVNDKDDYVYRAWLVNTLIPTIKATLEEIKRNSIRVVSRSSRDLDADNVTEALSGFFTKYLPSDNFHDIEQQLSVKVKELSAILQQQQLRQQEDEKYHAQKKQAMEAQEKRLQQAMKEKEQERLRQAMKEEDQERQQEERLQQARLQQEEQQRLEAIRDRPERRGGFMSSLRSYFNRPTYFH